MPSSRLLILFLGFWVSTQIEAADVEKVDFEKEIQPLFQEFCSNCHGNKEPRAGISLLRFKTPLDFLQKRTVSEKIADQLRSRKMPPEDQEQPSDEQRELLTEWIGYTLSKIDCKKVDPGRVTIRRLNRDEYRRTIRDLVGVDYQATNDFPADDIGYGFDNIGDVLSMSPILMEKYLTAAEEISQRVIVIEPKEAGEIRVLKPAEANSKSSGSDQGGGGWNLSSNGTVVYELDLPAGEYIIRTKAFQTPGGTEPAKLEIKIDDKSVRTYQVREEGNKPGQFEIKRGFSAGKHQLSWGFTNDFYDPKARNRNRRDRNLILTEFQVEGPLATPEISEIQKQILFKKPRSESDFSNTVAEVMQKFTTRAYRRPATTDEVERLVQLANELHKDGAGFEEAIQSCMQAVLVNPNFLFRIELDQEPDNPEAIHEISEFELASRMSFFLWSSMPDEDLYREAERGTLRKHMRVQIGRMLKDPRSKALVDNFATQWLTISRLSTVQPARRIFSEFDEDLRLAMRLETENYVAHIIQEDRSILEMLDSDYTFLNERLAKHYEIEGVGGPEFRKVTVDTSRRGGLLSQASILTVTSNPTRTSPVKRGKWVLENLLNDPPPPPPPGVPELPNDRRSALTGTLRQKMEQHRVDPNCASCHERLDPLGFGLENFDAIGRWRTKENGVDIDSSGTLPTGETFSGPQELRKILKGRQDEFARCFAEKLLTYGLGRGLEYYDKCAVDQIAASLKEGNYKFSTLVQSIIASEPFQKRRGRKPE